MKNVITRTITGIIYIASVVSSLIFDEKIFAIFFPILLFLCIHEFYTITSTDEIKPYKFIGAIISITLFYSNNYRNFEHVQIIGISVVILIVLGIFLFELFSKNSHPFHNLAYTFLGIIYIGLPFSLLPYIVNSDLTMGNYNYQIILSVFILLWSNDTGAYVFGMLFGKHRIFERVSPKKSWEGSIGGAIVATGISYILSLFYTVFSLKYFIILAFIVIVFGTLGDFIESHLKRFLGIKDSGNSLPGHGGFLDRFDSFIFTVPAVFVFIQFIYFFQQ